MVQKMPGPNVFTHAKCQLCTTNNLNHPDKLVETDCDRLSSKVKEEITRIYENETHNQSYYRKASSERVKT